MVGCPRTSSTVSTQSWKNLVGDGDLVSRDRRTWARPEAPTKKTTVAILRTILAKSVVPSRLACHHMTADARSPCPLLARV